MKYAVSYYPNYSGPPLLPGDPAPLAISTRIIAARTLSTFGLRSKYVFEVSGLSRKPFLIVGFRVRYGPYNPEIASGDGTNQDLDVFNLQASGFLPRGQWARDNDADGLRLNASVIAPQNQFVGEGETDYRAVMATASFPAVPPLEHCVNDAIADIWFRGARNRFDLAVFPADSVVAHYAPSTINIVEPLMSENLRCVGTHVLALTEDGSIFA